MKKILVLLILTGGLTYSSTIYIDISEPKYLTVNGDQSFNLNGLPLHMFTKKGRDTEARIYKLSGYQISGKVKAAEKLYSYFLEKISKEETFEEELNKLSELTTTEKENILNSMSKSFTSKWNDKGVKVIVSNSTNKKQFNNKTRKNTIFYDDVEHKLYFNEDLFDFTDKEKITGSIGYANYDHFLFYNSEKWNEWDFTDINDFFGVK